MEVTAWRCTHVAAVSWRKFSRRQLSISASKADRYSRQLEFPGGLVKVSIKRARRKTLAIHVLSACRVEMRVPLKCPWQEIDQFLESRHGWIENASESLASAPVVPELRYHDGAKHPYLGESIPLMLVRGRPMLTEFIQGRLVVRCSDPSDEAKVAAQIDQWYRRQAHLLFPELIEACRTRFPMALSYRGLVVRKMKSRWGSCSKQGEICLNSLLIRSPLQAIEFVIAHELCHLQHFSHNVAFYRLLTAIMPDWREREGLLMRG